MSLGSLSAANLLAGIIFSSIGIGAFIYGKKNAAWRPMVIGIVLMAYPYFFSSALVLYSIGIVLSLALFFWRE